MYFAMSWLVLLYPLYVIIMYCKSKEDNSIRQIFRESLLIYKPYEIRLGHFIGKTALFCALWAAAQYSYIRALDPALLDATDVSSLYATNFSFVYMLSWVILYEKFIALRIVAMIFSITGIVLFVYADGFGTASMWGVVLAVGSSASASIFKVLFKKFVGDISYGQLSMFMSLIGLCNLVCLWPIALILNLTNVEVVTHNLPWGAFCGSAAVLLVFHVLTHYAMRQNQEFVMGLGMVLGIPICADYNWKNREFHGMKISGVVIITVALILLLIPDKYPDRLCQLCTKCLQEDVQPQPRDRRHRLRGTNTKV
ncbi:hypothetical protein FSP39_020120 [Pinctada imbricata]|uniref:Uncharacterized protein n=1 Tax=Pinctada imbricata TaxID=66713 RepID=A0AA88XN73_PINIB|nr:hypothetical protein FSP39_020120 [Pinctada imbricata]